MLSPAAALLVTLLVATAASAAAVFGQVSAEPAATGAAPRGSEPGVPPEYPGLALRVTRSPGATTCPDEGALLKLLRSQRGVMPAFVSPPPLVIEVTFSETSEGLRATLVASGRRVGTRMLADPGPDCSALAQAVVVTVAMTVDEFLTDSPSPSTPPPAAGLSQPGPQRGPASAASASSKSARALRRGRGGETTLTRIVRKRDSRFGRSLWVGPGVAASLATPFGGSWLATVRLGMDLRRFSTGLGGFLTAPPGAVDDTPPPGRIYVSLGGGTLEGCLRVWGRPQRLGADLCPLLAMGALTGMGDGYIDDDLGTQVWGAVGVRAQLRGRLAGPLGYALGGPLLVALTPNEFHVQNAESPGFSTRRVSAWVGGELLLTVW